MTTQYSSRTDIVALTAAQSSTIADATVKSPDANERWLYSATATNAATDGLVLVPSDNPIQGRWFRQTDYAAQAAIIAEADAASVKSVGLNAPSGFKVSGSPVTGSGDLNLSADKVPAGFVCIGPASGDPAAWNFRALVASDIPALSYDAAGAANTALSAAKTYADETASEVSADIAALKFRQWYFGVF